MLLASRMNVGQQREQQGPGIWAPQGVCVRGCCSRPRLFLTRSGGSSGRPTPYSSSAGTHISGMRGAALRLLKCNSKAARASPCSGWMHVGLGKGGGQRITGRVLNWTVIFAVQGNQLSMLRQGAEDSSRICRQAENLQSWSELVLHGQFDEGETPAEPSECVRRAQATVGSPYTLAANTNETN